MKEALKSSNVPPLFTCPISLELLKDPVTLSTGQTYERSSIEKWISQGNLTCPVTMQKLHNPPSLVPNHTLHHLIHQWMQTNHYNSGPKKSILSSDSFSALKNNLECHSFSLDNKLQTLRIIGTLFEESSSMNNHSRDHDQFHFGCFLPIILELVFAPDQSQVLSHEYLNFVEEALPFVVKKLLPLCKLGPLNVLKEESQLNSLLLLLKNGSDMIKISLCHLLEAISSSSETKELNAALENTLEFSHEIIQLLHLRSEASKVAMKTLSTICNNPELNVENFIKEGAIDGVVKYIAESEESSLRLVAMRVLERLVGEGVSGREEVMKNRNVVLIGALVTMVFRVCNEDHEGSESALSLLLLVCSDSMEAREEAVKVGVLSQLLLLLQSQCSDGIKMKASTLLKLLRAKWDEERS